MHAQQVKIKTLGTSPIIETAVKVDEEAQPAVPRNFSGSAAVGGSWTDRMLTQGKKAQADAAPLPQDTREGAGDDEWT